MPNPGTIGGVITSTSASFTKDVTAMIRSTILSTYSDGSLRSFHSANGAKIMAELEPEEVNE